MPVPDSRAPPPAFASDPLIHVSSSGSMSTSVVNDAENHLGTTETGSTKPSTIDIEEIDDPSAANQAKFIRSVSPKSTLLLICSWFCTYSEVCQWMSLVCIFAIEVGIY